MKAATVLCLFAMVAFISAKPNTKYTNRYDDIDLSEILNNKRLLIPYLKCTLEQGKCSPEGKELKSHIREALETFCEKCTDAQRKGSRRVISHLINNEPQYWSQLTAKYDPNNKFVAKYENELKKVKAAA